MIPMYSWEQMETLLVAFLKNRSRLFVLIARYAEKRKTSAIVGSPM